MTRRIKVLGIGNPLVKDEGVGVRVAEELVRGYDFPPEVEVVDAGTMGMTMLPVLRQADHVIVVDAVDGTGHPPGTVVTMSPEDIAPAQILHSAHDMRLAHVLEAAALTGDVPTTDVVGVQIAAMVVGDLELSPEVEAAVPLAIDAVLSLLDTLGVRPAPRG